MEEACSRLSCSREPVALLTFSAAEAKAWLLDLATTDDTTSGIALCQQHADATAVPMSWQLIDKRDPAWPGSPKPGSVAAQLQGVMASSASAFAAELAEDADTETAETDKPTLKVVPNSEDSADASEIQDSQTQVVAEPALAGAATSTGSLDSLGAIGSSLPVKPSIDPIDPQIVEDSQDESEIVDAQFDADFEALSKEVTALRSKVAQMSELVEGDIKSHSHETHPSSGPLMID